MTTIPTIANRSMLRGLIGWNENHYEKWKVGSFGVKKEQSDCTVFEEEWNELVEKVKPYVEDQF